MIHLWKSLVLPFIKYCSVLVLRRDKTTEAEIGNLQRIFTAKIEETQELNDCDRFEKLKLTRWREDKKDTTPSAYEKY